MKNWYLRNLLNYIVFSITFIVICAGCNSGNDAEKVEKAKDIEFVTDLGSLVIRLYDETPQHRDNFIKLVKDGFYDSILFHRVIENFMVQAGDPDSRKASPADTLGGSDLPYTVPAEFGPKLFHKRGALGAARDGNPARASSSTQFYIVHGRIYTDSLLVVQEGRINKWLSMNRVVNDAANKTLVERRSMFYENSQSDSARMISEQLNELVEAELENADKYVIPEEHREVYRTIGGAAHLDQNYTVFGEVISGMEVIDEIAAAATNGQDRPIEDITIKTARLIPQKKYD